MLCSGFGHSSRDEVRDGDALTSPSHLPCLPVKLQANLHLTRRIRLCADLAECIAAEVRDRRSPDYAVEHVERLETHVKCEPARLERLRQTHILVGVPGQTNVAIDPRSIPQTIRRLDECCLVQIDVDRRVELA